MPIVERKFANSFSPQKGTGGLYFTWRGLKRSRISPERGPKRKQPAFWRTAATTKHLIHGRVRYKSRISCSNETSSLGIGILRHAIGGTGNHAEQSVRTPLSCRELWQASFYSYTLLRLE